jgi:hypothetical protein
MRRTRVVFSFLGVLTACIDASSISVDEEREMGLAVAEEATREMSLLQDEPIARFVRELGGHIVRRADTTGRSYEFRVIDQRRGRFAYCGNGGMGWSIVDVSNPRRMRLLKSSSVANLITYFCAARGANSTATAPSGRFRVLPAMPMLSSLVVSTV